LNERAPAKINVCLFLGPQRPDGRHELVTIFQPLALYDELTLEPAERDDVVCEGVEGRNLAADAVVAFREATGFAEGGSADAAAVLRLLSRFSGFEPDLLAIAERLGADVPGQVAPARYLATGAGELLEPLAPAEPYGVLVLPGPEPLSTAAVFDRAAALGLRRTAHDLAQRLAMVRAAGQDLPAELCRNDLEPAALDLMPEIGSRMKQARAAGADHVLLSGSGPTVLGFFRDPQTPGTVATL
jgi:4-diphosphocytidyl-2-C-methyl-D-erythritol kinase